MDYSDGHNSFQNNGRSHFSGMSNASNLSPHSGHIHFHSSVSDESDIDSDGEFVGPSKPPECDNCPDISGIEENDIKVVVMKDSGQSASFRAGNSSTPTTLQLCLKRELGMNSLHHFTPGHRCLLNCRFLPNRGQTVARMNHKFFCGTYLESGDVFVSASQDSHIWVNDVKKNFDIIKVIRCRDVGWSVLDVAFSPDNKYLAYSSWSDHIHLCNMYGEQEVHHVIQLSTRQRSFCIFSLKFSADNREIVSGANDGKLYLYDRESDAQTLTIQAHDDDVNTVIFADDSSQIIYSGGDDGLCKVWDRRSLKEHNPTPVGVMAGHVNGVAFIDSKNDARYFISNSKDQSIKLWDIRAFSSASAIEAARNVLARQSWDYRWQQVPQNLRRKRLVVGDTSVMTYRGHCVLHTLVRCRFSPAFSTGQRYIYTGCATGSIIVYDLLTGEVARKLQNGHVSIVRDVSWHPYLNQIISTSWDGSLCKWDCCSQPEEDDDRLAVDQKADGTFPRRSLRLQFLRMAN